jgi:uncharacterized repeat protein (TIGR03803 family)
MVHAGREPETKWDMSGKRAMQFQSIIQAGQVQLGLIMKMRFMHPFLLPVLVGALCLIPASRSPAQTFTNLHIFASISDDGTKPTGELVLSGNTLYGTAQNGGTNGYGMVFAVITNGTGYSNLYSFTALSSNTNRDGANPVAGLALSGNTLFGTAANGGPYANYGTVFAITTNGTGFTNLHSFAGSSTDGANPNGQLLLSGNTLYGTTYIGGPGTVFAVSTNGTGFTNLHSFGSVSQDGAYPNGGLVLSGSTLYGTTTQGGTNGYGMVFAVNTNGSGYTNLYSFTGNSDGGHPYCQLLLSGNTLYGTANGGGTNGNGTVFALTLNTNGSNFTTLHSFTNSPDGANPLGGLILSGNTLYGTTYHGGSSIYGAVFAINTNGSGYTNLYSFAGGSDGAYPEAELILSANTLYGTATQGGNGNGTVFGVILPVVSPVLTNIIVSPANPIIGVGSNEQFTATGYYSDGSSEVLTNEGGGSWTALPGLPVAAGGTACVALNGYFYVLGGFPDYDNYVYNPASNVWAAIPNMPEPYAYAAAVGIGTKLYVIGGCENSDCSQTGSELYIYDTVSNSWSTGASMPLARTQTGVGVINGQIYVVGGGLGSSDLSQSNLQIYTPASNTWTNGPSMPNAVTLCAAAVLNGKLYVVGGYSTSTASTLGSLYVYDPTIGSWTNKMSLPTPRFSMEAAAVNGLLYAIDGTTASGTGTNLVEIYNPATDSWITGVPTLTPHSYGEAGVINETVYLAGCGPGNTAITNAEAFTPLNVIWSSSGTNVASVNTNGVATGLTNGVTTITATSGTVSGNTTLTVVLPPDISIPPTNTTISPDGSITFNVSATGGDLSYQWLFNGTNIAGAAGASFTITKVSPAMIGVYSVIVSNASGSVTSSSAMLASVGIAMFAGVIVDGPIGSNYLIQSSSNLASTNWTTLTNVTLPTQPYIYIDYSSPTNPLQFYRAVPQ